MKLYTADLVVVFIYATLTIVYGNVLKEIEEKIINAHPHEFHDDGPWQGHLDKHLNQLKQHKDDAVHQIEKHAEQKVFDIQAQKQEEKQQLFEHERVVKEDIENKYIISQNLLLKQGIEKKQQELEKLQHELEQKAYYALYNLEILERQVELKIHALKLQTTHNLETFEKQKHEMVLKKYDVEKLISIIMHNIEEQKFKEHQHIMKYEHILLHHDDQQLHDLEHRKQELAQKQHYEFVRTTDSTTLIPKNELTFKPLIDQKVDDKNLQTIPQAIDTQMVQLDSLATTKEILGPQLLKKIELTLGNSASSLVSINTTKSVTTLSGTSIAGGSTISRLFDVRQSGPQKGII